MAQVCGVCAGKTVSLFDSSEDRKRALWNRCTICGKLLCANCSVVISFPQGQLRAIKHFYTLNPHPYHSQVAQREMFMLCKPCNQSFSNGFFPMARDYFEKAGRDEDLAQLYEAFGMPAEAGKARAKAKHQTVKHVTVDINALIEKLKQGGLAIPYKCQSCGATIKIDETSRASGLQQCPYCNSTLDVDAIARMLRDILS
jgi:predicted Zn-ribbon and HTH transcriptional regulator